MFNNTLQKVKIMSRQRLNYRPYSLYPGVKVLDFCDADM